MIDYRVSWDQGTGDYTVIASGITSTSYTTIETLTANTYYKFKVESRNAFGFSPSLSNDVVIRTASLPTTPQTLPNNTDSCPFGCTLGDKCGTLSECEST